MALSIHVPSAQTRRHILEWSVPWHVLCLSALFAWGNYPLSTFSTRPTYQLYFVAMLCAAVVLALIGKQSASLFDRPIVLLGTAILFIGATAIVMLPALGSNPAETLLIAAYCVCGIGTALLFVMWCECLAAFSSVRVMFTLCLNMVIALIMIWFTRHLDGAGLYVGQILLALIGCVGVRRSWEMDRGHESGNQTHNQTHIAQTQSATETSDNPSSTYHWHTLAAIFITTVCIVGIKSLANDAVIEYVSLGGAIAPVVILTLAATCTNFKLSHAYLGTLALAMLAALSIQIPFDGASQASIVLSDVSFSGLFIILGTLCSSIAAHSHASVCRLAGVACAVFAPSALAGAALGSWVVTVLPLGARFTAVIALFIVLMICEAICLTDAHGLDVPIALDADTEPSTYRVSSTSSVSNPLVAQKDSSADFNCPQINQEAINVFANTHGLQRRRTEVLGLLLQGMSAGQIARELVIAQGTAKAHIHGVYQTLGVHSRDELVELVRTEAPDVMI